MIISIVKGKVLLLIVALSTSNVGAHISGTRCQFEGGSNKVNIAMHYCNEFGENPSANPIFETALPRLGDPIPFDVPTAQSASFAANRAGSCSLTDSRS